MTTHDASLQALLEHGDLTVEGQLAAASNATLRCTIDGSDRRCVYKPVSGERPLWDFPDGTLGRREVAAYELSVLAGWPVVPMTVWREEGPFGPGMCQVWVDEDPDQSVVEIVPVQHERPDWISVLEGEDAHGRRVRLIHAHAEDLQAVALLDAVMNNADRKGGHLLVGRDERLWAIDHGVCFAADPKLRTVLWGWAGQGIPEPALARLRSLDHDLRSAAGQRVRRWLDDDEIDALLERSADLLATGTFPVPTPHWPSLPWPVF